MKRELDELLCKKYPKMFVNRNKSMQETAMCWGFSCGDGWFNLIDELCDSIQHYIDYNNRPDHPVPQVIVDQVKEKFGTLRFYYHGGNDIIHGMVWFAESMSSRICDKCGHPGTRKSDNGWVYTACEAHSKVGEECND